jgi:hypothetical protein
VSGRHPKDVKVHSFDDDDLMTIYYLVSGKLNAISSDSKSYTLRKLISKHFVAIHIVDNREINRKLKKNVNNIAMLSQEIDLLQQLSPSL